MWRTGVQVPSNNQKKRSHRAGRQPVTQRDTAEKMAPLGLELWDPEPAPGLWSGAAVDLKFAAGRMPGSTAGHRRTSRAAGAAARQVPAPDYRWHPRRRAGHHGAHPGLRQRHTALGGSKVTPLRFAARPSGTEVVCKIDTEPFRGPDYLRRIQEEARSMALAALGA